MTTTEETKQTVRQQRDVSRLKPGRGCPSETSAMMRHHSVFVYCTACEENVHLRFIPYLNGFG